MQGVTLTSVHVGKRRAINHLVQDVSIGLWVLADLYSLCFFALSVSVEIFGDNIKEAQARGTKLGSPEANDSSAAEETLHVDTLESGADAAATDTDAPKHHHEMDHERLEHIKQLALDQAVRLKDTIDAVARKNPNKHLTKDKPPGKMKMDTDGDNDIDELQGPQELSAGADGLQYEVLEELKHDPTSFTQGLSYSNGMLYESTGLYFRSKVRILDPFTGDVVKSVDMDKQFFGEGMCYYGDNSLIQITWRSKQGFVYDATTLEQIQKFTYSTSNGEGWGITLNSDTNELVVSDGSNNLHFWDPTTLEEIRRVPVFRQDGTTPVRRLNELEYINKRIYANIWQTNEIVAINPETALVTESYDFSDIYLDRAPTADVLNGISISDKPGEVFITGKQWPKIYRVRLYSNGM